MEYIRPTHRTYRSALTEHGESNARNLGERLKALSFDKVFTSPLQRAMRTCELAGLAIEPKSIATWWNGTTANTKDDAQRKSTRSVPTGLFRDGCPGGESPRQVGERATRVAKRIHKIQGNVLIFSSGHVLRVLAARWLGLEPAVGQYLLLSTASFSALGYEHNWSQPAIQLWNDTNHVVS
jgi:broad specificity phosphatase PhoE